MKTFFYRFLNIFCKNLKCVGIALFIPVPINLLRSKVLEKIYFFLQLVQLICYVSVDSGFELL